MLAFLVRANTYANVCCLDGGSEHYQNRKSDAGNVSHCARPKIEFKESTMTALTKPVSRRQVVKIRPTPCRFCPYRRDVPSGVWNRSDYLKLLDYDKPTGEQPFAPFGCHEVPKLFCTGWAQCHGWELISLRIADFFHGPFTIPPIKTPLFKSGHEAAEHGLKQTGLKAKRAILYILKLRRRKQLLNSITEP